MGLLAIDELANELEKIGDVPRDQTAAFASRVAKLLEITPAAQAGLVGPGRVEAARAKHSHDPGREVLVEMEPHSARRTRPGYRAMTASGVRRASTSIRCWISSR